MIVDLAYGRGVLPIEVPDSATVLCERPVPGVPDEPAAIRAALRSPIGAPPLAEVARPGLKVVVAHTDITRATPNDRLLPVVLEELERAGVRRGDITLLNALGTHRPQTDLELRQMLGSFIVDNYRCLQHNAFDDANLVDLGTTGRGAPVRLNCLFWEADLKLTTGFIEPHFFAGFSGGPKGMLPALSGAESVFSNHGWGMIADPHATWGETKGNPIWEEMRSVALRVSPLFLVNVTLNAQRAITGVFAGEVVAAHRAGCDFARQSVAVDTPEPFDIVITSNSGYPLDQNLYQGVKGMSAASRLVREGGAIILAAACSDGLPDHGRYAELLAQAGSPQGVLDLLAQPGFSAHDQWQVQIQAQIQQRAEVYVHAGGLTDAQIERALLRPARDLPATLARLLERYGPQARVAVLPEGPKVFATVTRAVPV